ncbi:hypothetical protein Syun_022232 [Stephania yunnanensis]|uniref:SIAH-type domain-containing protein n=1 Tax=Stephania yunnanensis TaxID=152371 RepID=A0AAP0NRV0_9MAGN
MDRTMEEEGDYDWEKKMDCPRCFQLLVAPVYQCLGCMKVACNSCHTELKKHCGGCSRYIGDFRSVGVEKYIKLLPCPQAIDGCHKARSHDGPCVFPLCHCPETHECDFSGTYKDLTPHYSEFHASLVHRFEYGGPFTVTLEKNVNARHYAVLQAEPDDFAFPGEPPLDEDQFEHMFVLNMYREEGFGYSITLNHIGWCFGKSFTYKLSWRKEGEGGCSLKLNCSAKFVSKREEERLKDDCFLLVPFALVEDEEPLLTLKVTIWKIETTYRVPSQGDPLTLLPPTFSPPSPTSSLLTSSLFTFHGDF